MFEFAEHSLDHVALFVECPVAGVRISPVVAGRDDGRGTHLVDGVEKVFGIIGPVRDDVIGPEALDQFARVQDIAAMTRRGDETQRRAKRIAGRMQLGCQAPFGAAKALGFSPPFFSGAPAACWWARMTVLSTDSHSKSGSSFRALKISRKTPRLIQS